MEQKKWDNCAYPPIYFLGTKHPRNVNMEQSNMEQSKNIFLGE